MLIKHRAPRAYMYHATDYHTIPCYVLSQTIGKCEIMSSTILPLVEMLYVNIPHYNTRDNV